MHTALARLAKAPIDVNTDHALSKGQALLLAAAALVFVYIGLKAALANYKQGNMKGAANTLGVVGISTVIIAVGATVGLIAAIGGGFLNAGIGLLS